MAEEILAATTSAAATEEFELQDPQTLPVSISAYGVASGEYVTLQYHDGTDWRDYYQDGAVDPVRVTPTHSMLSIWAVGRWRGDKSATASAVAVKLHTRHSP